MSPYQNCLHFAKAENSFEQFIHTSTMLSCKLIEPLFFSYRKQTYRQTHSYTDGDELSIIAVNNRNYSNQTAIIVTYPFHQA